MVESLKLFVRTYVYWVGLILGFAVVPGSLLFTAGVAPVNTPLWLAPFAGLLLFVISLFNDCRAMRPYDDGNPTTRCIAQHLSPTLTCPQCRESAFATVMADSRLKLFSSAGDDSYRHIKPAIIETSCLRLYHSRLQYSCSLRLHSEENCSRVSDASVINATRW